MYLAKSTDHGASFPTQLQQLQLTSGTRDQVMPWMAVTPGGRVDTVFYDYDEATGLMDAVYGQVAAGGSQMSQTIGAERHRRRRPASSWRRALPVHGRLHRHRLAGGTRRDRLDW